MSSKRLTVVKPTSEPSYKAFDEFAESAQHLLEEWEPLSKGFRETVQCIQELNTLTALRSAERALNGRKLTWLKALRDKCKAYSASFGPDFDDFNSEDEGEAYYKSQISLRVARLLGSFPTSNVPDPKIYTRTLVEEVIAAQPMLFAVESACRTILRTMKFVPAVSEVLSVVNEQNSLWSSRCMAVADVCADYNKLELLCADLAELHRRETEFGYRRSAAPFRRGERIVHWRFGPGVVRWDQKGVLMVEFDDKRWRNVVSALVEPEVRPAQSEHIPSATNATFPVGTRVRHRSFGVGTVADAEGSKLTVDFDNGGRKLLLDSFVEIEAAPLQIEHQPIINPLAGLKAATATVEVGHGE